MDASPGEHADVGKDLPVAHIPLHLIANVRLRSIAALLNTVALSLLSLLVVELMSKIVSAGNLPAVWLVLFLGTGAIGGLIAGHWSGMLTVPAGYSIGLLITIVFAPPLEPNDDDLVASGLAADIIGYIIVWCVLTVLILPSTAFGCHKSVQHRHRVLATSTDPSAHPTPPSTDFS